MRNSYKYHLSLGVANFINKLSTLCFCRIQLGGNELPKALVEPEVEELSDEEESAEEIGMLI